MASNISPEVAWGIFLAANALPAWSIGSYLNNKSQFKDIIDAVQENLLLQHGHGISTEASRYNSDPTPWFIIGIAIGASGFVGWGGVVVSIILWVWAVYCDEYNGYIAPIINKIQAQKRQELKQAKLAENVKGFAEFDEPSSDDDDYFSSNAQQEKPRSQSNGSRTRSSGNGSQPYGVDKRHPDDKALWAKVDDPSATSSERQSAFTKILEREARRGNAQPASSKNDDNIRYLK